MQVGYPVATVCDVGWGRDRARGRKYLVYNREGHKCPYFRRPNGLGIRSSTIAVLIWQTMKVPNNSQLKLPQSVISFCD
jgi:hypothetical protein